MTPHAEKNTYTSITCPQCGSNKITPLDDDQYLCASCQTVFGLDKKKISVEIKHQYDDPLGTLHDKTARYIQIFLVAILGIPLLIFIIASLFGSKTPQSSYTTSTASVTKEENRNIDISQSITYSQSGTSYFATISTSKNKENIALFVNIFDEKKSLIASQKIVEKALATRSITERFDIDVEKIADAIYLVLDNKNIYILDPLTAKVLKDNTSLIKEIPEFSEGIAIAGLSDNWGPYLEVTTPSGTKYFYFFQTGELVKPENIGKRVERRAPIESTYYTFFTRGNASNEKLYLQKITANIDPRGPSRDCHKCIELDFAEKSKNTTYIGYVPSPENIKRDYFITNITPILPERNFIEPKILDYTNNAVLIQFNTSVAEDSPHQIQLIDDTGKILDTLEVKEYVNTAHFNEKYITVTQSREFLVYDRATKTFTTIPEEDIKNILLEKKVFIQ